MVNHPELKRQLLAWIREHPNEQLRGDARKHFYTLYKEFINPQATLKQCYTFV